MSRKKTEETEVKTKETTEVKAKKQAWRRKKTTTEDQTSQKKVDKTEKVEKAECETTQQLGSLPLDGLTYKTCLTDKYLHRQKYNPTEPGTVYSKIPGTIKSIAVKLNQEIEEGEILCILDAMKMNNEILSPYKGTVTEINVKAGQIVAKDVLLFKIEVDQSEEDEEVEDDDFEEDMI